MQPLFTFRDSIKVVSVGVALRGRRVSPDADPNQTPLPIDIREELEDLQIRPGLIPQEGPIVAVIRLPGGDVLRENPVAHIARGGIGTLISYRIAFFIGMRGNRWTAAGEPSLKTQGKRSRTCDSLVTLHRASRREACQLFSGPCVASQ